MTKRLMEGSEAIAEAMVAAGCRFFAGYPMTPFTEVLENMARLLPPVGGTCINAESELEAVGMAWGASAAGARAATGSVGQGLSLMQESLSELTYARVPMVVLNMARGQGDYYQATRGGGHGDYRHIVLAPCDSAEAVRIIQLAFHLADVWRTPVTFLGDYYLAHVHESVDTSRIDFGPVPDKPWAATGATNGSGQANLISPIHTRASVRDPNYYGGHLMLMSEHVEAMRASVEPLYEETETDDADVLVVAYGTPARYLRHVVGEMRAVGHRVGLFRPITLWPFPDEALRRAAAGTRRVVVYELNTGQMYDDVRLAIEGRVPVQFIGGMSFDAWGFGVAPDLDVEILTERVLAAMPANEEIVAS